MKTNRFAQLVTVVMTASLALPCAPSLLAQAARSPRDAYIEAWFKETAEADLTSALTLYKECADQAAATDRELAAKALLRIVRIARARGDEEAATLVEARIRSEFAGTLSSSDLEKGNADTATGSAPAESREVLEARRWLDEMLSTEGDNSSQKATTILRVLGIDEVLRVHAARGGRLSSILNAASADALTVDQWLDLATRADSYDSVLYAAFLKLVKQPPTVIPEALAKRVEESDAETVGRFVDLCLAVGTPEAFHRAEALLRATMPRFRGGIGITHIDRLFQLIQLDDASSARLVAAWLDGIDAGKAPGTMLEGVGLPETRYVVLEPTAGAEVFWARFPSWTLRARLRFAEIISFNRPLPPDGVFAVLRSDPEPRIRMISIKFDLASSDLDKRRLAARALEAESAPVDVEFLREAINRKGSPPPIEVFEETTGSLREYAYWVNLTAMGHTESIRAGLAQGHLELLYALFDPRFDRDRRLQWGGSRSSRQAPAVTQQTLRSALELDSDPDLLRKAVAAALEIPDPNLHVAVLESLDSLATSRSGTGLGESFAALGEVHVDLRLLTKSPYRNELSEATFRRYLKDPRREVRQAAIQACDSPALLHEIVAECDLQDLESLHTRTSEIGFGGLRIEVLKRVDPDSDTAVYAFWSLLARSGEGFALACERGGDARLGREADLALSCLIGMNQGSVGCEHGDTHAAFRDLRVPALIVEGLLNLPGMSRQERRREWAALLRANLEAWDTALIDREARRLVMERQADSVSQLAALGARDFAIELLEHPYSQRRTIGLETLAELGEAEIVIEYARSHAVAEEWVYPLLRVGADDEMIAQLRSGRVSAATVLKTLTAMTHPGTSRNQELRPVVLRELLLNGDEIDRGLLTGLGDATLRFIDALVATKDVAGLAELEWRYEVGQAIPGLFQLRAFEELFTLFLGATRGTAERIYKEMVLRTGYGDSMPYDLRSTREALVLEWRKRL